MVEPEVLAGAARASAAVLLGEGEPRRSPRPAACRWRRLRFRHRGTVFSRRSSLLQFRHRETCEISAASAGFKLAIGHPWNGRHRQGDVVEPALRRISLWSMAARAAPARRRRNSPITSAHPMHEGLMLVHNTLVGWPARQDPHRRFRARSSPPSTWRGTFGLGGTGATPRGFMFARFGLSSRRNAATPTTSDRRGL